MSPFSRRLHADGRWPRLGLTVGVVALMVLGLAELKAALAPVASAATGCSLVALLALLVEQLARVDIARMNLACAEGLPGAGSLDLARNLNTLDAWAQRVKAETERHRYRFQQKPAEFEHSDGFFRMLMLVVVLAEDYGVHYKREGRIDPAQASAQDGFFTNAADVFLPGLLGPKRQGTCSSLPVLHSAVGPRFLVADLRRNPNDWRPPCLEPRTQTNKRTEL